MGKLRTATEDYNVAGDHKCTEDKKEKIINQGSSTSTKCVNKRSPNWTEEEENDLIYAVLRDHDVLFGKFTSKLDKSKKQAAWRIVAEQVNCKANIARDVDTMQAKYRDLKSRIKKKASCEVRRRTKTGGGGDSEEDDPLTDVEEKWLSLKTAEKTMVKFYGKTWLLGIESGFDSSTVKTVPSQIGNSEPDTQNDCIEIQEKEITVENKQVESQKVKNVQVKLTKEMARAKISSDMLCTQDNILKHVMGIDISLKEMVELKKKKYGALGYL